MRSHPSRLCLFYFIFVFLFFFCLIFCLVFFLFGFLLGWFFVCLFLFVCLFVCFFVFFVFFFVVFVLLWRGCLFLLLFLEQMMRSISFLSNMQLSFVCYQLQIEEVINFTICMIYQKRKQPNRLGLYYLPTASFQRGKTTTSVLDMTQNRIWWWGSSPGALRKREYLFIAIAPRFTLTQNGSTC